MCHSSGASLSIETKNSVVMRKEDNGGTSALVLGFQTSQILDGNELILVTSTVNRRESMMHILRESMRMLLDDLKLFCTARFGDRTMKNMELKRFALLSSYHFDLPDERNIIQHDPSIYRSCSHCLSAIKIFRQRKRTR